MKFWERVKKDLRVAMREGADLLKEGSAALRTEAGRFTRQSAVSVRSEARRMARLGRLRYQLYRANRKAQIKFAEVGGKVYDLASEDLKKVKVNRELRELMLEIRGIEGQIRVLDSEIANLSRLLAPVPQESDESTPG
jgi:hypothetical protein